jgi:thiosulfate/3-mercaptopyruvate sulfurtransferase
MPFAIALLCALIAAAAPLRAQSRAAERVPLLVDGAWLSRHLTDARQVIIHAAAARAEYDAGHVPGARLLPFASYAPQLDGLSAQMAPLAQLDSALESLGVNDGDRLIIYGQPIPVARLLVTLDYLGLRDRVSILNGGMDAWRDAERPVSREAPPVASRGRFTPMVDSSVMADIGWVSANTATAGVKLLDARAPEFYLGYSPGSMPRAGHIPGAQNIPFSSLTGELTQLRAEPKLSRLFAAAGVKRGDTVVTYCHIGMQASILYLAARHLGYRPRIFDGSFEEWSKRSDLPVVVEADKR